jgi:Tol biopolymer transport system component
MNANGSGQTRLTADPAIDNLPDWAPNGSRLAFHSTRDSNLEIYVINPDGSGEDRLTNTSPGAEAAPAWSPDGTKLAVDGLPSLDLIDSDGNPLMQVTSNTCQCPMWPDWQPLVGVVGGLAGPPWVGSASHGQARAVLAGAALAALVVLPVGGAAWRARRAL